MGETSFIGYIDSLVSQPMNQNLSMNMSIDQAQINSLTSASTPKLNQKKGGRKLATFGMGAMKAVGSLLTLSPNKNSNKNI